MNEYEKQATDFLRKTNTTINVEFSKHDVHFVGDKDKRDIYKVTIKRGDRSFSFNFEQSLHCSGEYVCPLKIAYVEKLCGKFNLKNEEYNKLSSHNKTYFKKNENYEIPSNYDVLCCLQKYEVGSLENFCSDFYSEFGYDSDGCTVDEIYISVCNEYDNVCKIWNDEEIEQLQEIQ